MPATAGSPKKTPSDAVTTTRDFKRSTVKVDVDELVVGRRLQFPIYDANGLLLLAEETVLTESFKRRLKARQIAEVELHPQDAAEIQQKESPPEQSFTFDCGLVQVTEALIDAGKLSVHNTGPAVHNSVVYHGCKAYDPERRRQLLERHEVTTRSLDNQMQRALRGEKVNTSEIMSLAADYVSELISDSDHVVSVAAEVRRDTALSERCLQMGLLGMCISIEMGLDEDNVRAIGICGLVHDWGMAKLPDHLRHASAIPNDVERSELERHPLYTLHLLESMQGMPSVVPLVCYQVHERPNGSGYPRGRRWNTIHPFARSLNVVNEYLSLTSSRTYRPPLMPYAAMEYLLREISQQTVSGEGVRSLLNVLSLFPIGSYVQLSDGSTARVLRRNGNNYLSPIVQRVQDRHGIRIDAAHGSEILDPASTDLAIVRALPTPGREEIALNPAMLR